MFWRIVSLYIFTRFILIFTRILNHPTCSSEYGTTRKNIHQYYTLEHLLRYMYFCLNCGLLHYLHHQLCSALLQSFRVLYVVRQICQREHRSLCFCASLNQVTFPYFFDSSWGICCGKMQLYVRRVTTRSVFLSISLHLYLTQLDVPAFATHLS